MISVEKLLRSNGHAKLVVVDNDPKSLHDVVTLLKSRANPSTIKGYSNYKQFLEELNISKAKQTPFGIVLIRQDDVRTKFLSEIAKQAGSMVFLYESPETLCPQIGSDFCLLRQYL